MTQTYQYRIVFLEGDNPPLPHGPIHETSESATTARRDAHKWMQKGLRKQGDDPTNVRAVIQRREVSPWETL